ncbi:MAG: class I SAM-dependent methyltransferase [Sediminibacterium sp.]|nr:class I SAM-dependent methyltransferase [Sediminibacterium sp.]
MFERHHNRQLYFNEQSYTTEKYVIPYINEVKKITAKTVVAEIGCGECGNLKPFLDIGCKVVGIDFDPVRIDLAKTFLQNHPNYSNVQLIAEDIYQTDSSKFPLFDVVILRDTIEHIPNQAQFIEFLKKFLKPDAVVFFGFPPWRMPFGGHQQLCNSWLKKAIYLHLLPRPVYLKILSLCGESPSTINDLNEIEKTKISIHRFHKIVNQSGFKIIKEDHFLFNPNYDIKFKIKPKKVLPIFRIPFFKDFYTMCLYSIIQLKANQ